MKGQETKDVIEIIPQSGEDFDFIIDTTGKLKDKIKQEFENMKHSMKIVDDLTEEHKFQKILYEICA